VALPAEALQGAALQGMALPVLAAGLHQVVGVRVRRSDCLRLLLGAAPDRRCHQ
jgi:hypothetical protein